MQKYTNIRVPVLAIYAAPHIMASTAEEALDTARMQAITNAFEKGIPSARVVRLPRADHFIFRSNEAEVLQEINAFVSGLP